MTNVNIEKTVVGRRLALEESLSDFFSRNHVTCGAHQHLQEIELDCGQIQRRIRYSRFTCRSIDLNPTNNETALSFHFTVSVRRSTARILASSSSGSKGLGR